MNGTLRTVVLAVAAAGSFFALVSFVDATGMGAAAPWIGQAPPMLGRWGAYFGTSPRHYLAVVLNTDRAGPSDRADLEAGDLVDTRRNSALERFWEFYRAPNGAVVDLSVLRPTSSAAAQLDPEATRLVTGPSTSLLSVLPSHAGALWFLLLALLIAWRKFPGPRDALLTTVLLLLGIGIVSDPFSFGALWEWVYIALAICNLSLPLSVGVWSTLTGSFGVRTTLRRRLEWLCWIFVAAAVGVGIAQMVAIYQPSPLLDPVRLVFGWASVVPMIGAVVTATICSILAIISSRGLDRSYAALILGPFVAIYCFTEANAVAKRVSQSYVVNHYLLIIENVVLLAVPLVLTVILAHVNGTNLFAQGRRYLSGVTSRVLNSRSNTVRTVGAIAVGGIFILLLIQYLTSRAIIVSDLNVPKDFADRGFSSGIESLRLADELNRYTASARTSLRPTSRYAGNTRAAAALETAVVVPVAPVVPILGLPIDYLADAAAGVFHLPKRQHITGEFTEADGNLWLRLRLNDDIVFNGNEPIPKGTQPFAKADELLNEASACLFERVQPYYVAANLYNDHSLHDGVLQSKHLAEWIVDNSGLPDDDPNVILSHLLLAGIYAGSTNEGDPASQINKAMQFEDGAVNHVWRGLYYMFDSRTRYNKLGTKARMTEYRSGTDCKQETYGTPLGATYDRKLHGCSQIRYEDYQALYEFNVALNVDSDYAMARSGLGQYYQGVGERSADNGDRESAAREFNQSLREYRMAIRLEPDRVEHWSNLAKLYIDMQDYPKVMTIYRRMLQYDPNYNLASELVAFLQERRHARLAQLWRARIHVISAREAFDSLPDEDDTIWDDCVKMSY